MGITPQSSEDRPINQDQELKSTQAEINRLVKKLNENYGVAVQFISFDWVTLMNGKDVFVDSDMTTRLN
jgi:ABC-type oligopeptide transport system ATPase subunit